MAQQPCIAQPFPRLNFRSITEANGLSNNIITDITQDKKGIMWIGSNNGLNRYDGTRIKKIYANTKDSTALQNNTVTNFANNADGSIWMESNNGLVKMNPSTEAFSNYPILSNCILRLPQKQIFFCKSGVYNEVNGKISKDTGWNFEPFTFYNSKIDQYTRIAKDKNENVWASAGNRLYRLDVQTKKIVQTYLLPQLFIIQDIFFDSQNQCWLSTWGGGLYKFNAAAGTFTKIFAAEKQILAFAAAEWVFNEKRYIVVCTDMNYGLILLDPITLKYQSYLGLNNHHEGEEIVQVHYAFTDKDDNLWLATNNGVRIASVFGALYNIIPIKIPRAFNPYADYSDVNRYVVYQFKEWPSGYWLTQRYGGGIFHYDKNWNLLHYWPTLVPDEKNRFGKLFTTNEGYDFKQVKDIMYITTSVGMVMINVNTYQVSMTYANDTIPPSLRTIVPLNDTSWMIRSVNRGVFVFNPVKNKFTKQYIIYEQDGMRIRNLHHLKKTNDGQIIASTSTGMLLFEPTTDRFLPLQLQGTLSSDYYGMDCDKKGVLWAGTSNGLIAIDVQQKKVVKDFSEYPDMGIVSWIAIDDNDNIWFICPKGYWCWMQKTQRMVKFSFEAGLPDNQPEGGFFKTNDGSIYGGGINALVKFNTSLLEKYAPGTRTVITDIKSYGIAITTAEMKNDSSRTLTLNPRQNNIDLYFSVTDYSQPGNYEYYYKLTPGKNEWLKTEQGHIGLNNLEYGTYTLEVKGQSNITGTYSLPDMLEFTIKPKWYQTIWFKILFFLIIAGILYALAKWRTRQIKEKAKLKSDYENKMIHLEMQNLRSQMNPHFIFNSLNSINSFVVENKTHLASDYLTKFSRLIRLILDNSKNESISLEKELETLKLYLLMESLRFDKKFDYAVHIDDGIDEQATKVPPMIIQPYVENAIWHGLLHKNEKGKVDVHLKKIQQALQIIIEDNGIGRAKAAVMKSKNIEGTKSYGMQITALRIEQLNRKNKVETIDLTDEQGNASGTRVTVTIYIDA
jgi:ligand-binding sensor domain-containing protein